MSPRRATDAHRGLAGPQTGTPAAVSASKAPITKPLDLAAARAQQSRRTHRDAITARLAPVLTHDEQRIAEALELTLENRLRLRQVIDLAHQLRAPTAPPLHNEVAHALFTTLRRQQHLRDALHADCPPLLRCREELCAWHRRALKRWWDARDPIARAFLGPHPGTALAKETTR